MRRVLNAFLQFIDQDESESLIVAATNNPKLLDSALFRRFDDVLYYQHPGSEERQHLIENILGVYMGQRFSWQKIIAASEGLSHAEIDNACRDAIKSAILCDKDKVVVIELLKNIEDRHNYFKD